MKRFFSMNFDHICTLYTPQIAPIVTSPKNGRFRIQFRPFARVKSLHNRATRRFYPTIPPSPAHFRGMQAAFRQRAEVDMLWRNRPFPARPGAIRHEPALKIAIDTSPVIGGGRAERASKGKEGGPEEYGLRACGRGERNRAKARAPVRPPSQPREDLYPSRGLRRSGTVPRLGLPSALPPNPGRICTPVGVCAGAEPCQRREGPRRLWAESRGSAVL